jgi:Peptidase C13 family
MMTRLDAMKRRYSLVVAAIFSAVFLGACATNPYKGEAKSQSDQWLQQQLALADTKRRADPAPSIIFAGFAMHSQSKAFRNDVLTLERNLLAMDPRAIVFKLDNPAMGQGADWPFATTENVAQVLKKVGALARPQDKVVILFSTHGSPGVLSVNISNQYFPFVSPAVLNQWLADLRGKPTLLVLSACFSGSFLPQISGPSRIVLTAAAQDRSSFGCEFHSTNTHFVDALFNQAGVAEQSVEQMMERAKMTIEQRERDLKLSPPSLPQVFIGPAAAAWARRPLKDWLVY